LVDKLIKEIGNDTYLKCFEALEIESSIKVCLRICEREIFSSNFLKENTTNVVYYSDIFKYNMKEKQCFCAVMEFQERSLEEYMSEGPRNTVFFFFFLNIISLGIY
jgi:hypothetical protein